MGKIVAVCLSEEKGVQKRDVGTVELIKEHGIKGDAHAGKWHRQVSLLSYEKVEEFKKKGVNVDKGAFGENLLVQGIDLAKLPIGTKLKINEDIELEVTQIGKKCHSGCAIYKAVGDCIMPREGIFTRVLKGGIAKVGDIIEVIEK